MILQIAILKLKRKMFISVNVSWMNWMLESVHCRMDFSNFSYLLEFYLMSYTSSKNQWVFKRLVFFQLASLVNLFTFSEMKITFILMISYYFCSCWIQIGALKAEGNQFYGLLNMIMAFKEVNLFYLKIEVLLSDLSYLFQLESAPPVIVKKKSEVVSMIFLSSLILLLFFFMFLNQLFDKFVCV